MTRQLTDTVEATAEPFLVLEPMVPKGGAQQGISQRRRELVPTTAAPAGRNGIHECCHHWIIEVALGPLSKGVCKACGEERLFRNQLRWEEITPVRVMNGRRQEKDLTVTPDQTEAAAFVLAGSRYGSFKPPQPAV